MRLIDAYKRGYLSEAEYLVYLNTGYTNDSMVNVTVDPYVYSPYLATMRLIKRDPNLRLTIPIEIEGTGEAGVLVQGDKAYAQSSVEGRIVGYSIFVDTTSQTQFDVWVKSTFPPSAGETIVGISHPYVSSDVHVEGDEQIVAAWSTHILEGDFIAIEVDSNTAAHRALCTLYIEPATQLNALI